MSTVVEKEFVWRFVDEVTTGLRQAQSVMEQTLSVFRSAGSIANESTSGLENFGDSAKEMSEKIKNSTNDCKEDINKIKKSVDDLPKNKITKIDTKANTEGINKAKEEINKIPSKKTTTLNSKADTNDAKKFNNEIKLTPKQRITKLLANAKTSVINSFKRSIDDVPKKHTTDLDANPTGESKIKSFGETLKGTALGMGVYNAAMKVGSAVSNEFAGAISRYDTLNNYPKVLESMGASANDANTSMKTLKNGVDGLPTSLDSVAKASQRFLPMSKNANDAAKSALALNDAFLASGASSEDASRGLEQYTQMLSSGKVDLESWKTLEETMPASLKKVSESFGIAGGSAQGLYQKLQSGQISVKQLNQRFQELDKGTKGFHETAKSATGGIGTAFENMGNRMKAAIQEAMGGFDKFVQKLTGKSIAGNINDLTSKFSDFGKKAGEALSSLGDYLKPLTPAFQALGLIIGTVFKSAVKPIQDIAKALGDMFKNVKDSKAFDDISKSLQGIAKNKTALEGVGKAVTTMIAAFAGAKALSSTFTMISKGIGVFTTLGKAINNIKSFKGALAILQFELKNLVSALGGIPGVIAIVVGAFVTLYNVNPKFKKFIDDIVKNVKNFAKNFVNGFKTAFNNVGKFFKGDLGWQKDLEKNLNKIGNSISKAVKPWIKPIQNCFSDIGKIINKDVVVWEKNIDKFVKSVTKFFSSLGKDISSIWNTITKNIDKGIKGIQKVINPVLNTISKEWNKVWNGLANTISNVMKNISKFVTQHMGNIKNIINSGVKIIKTIWDTIWKQIENVFKLVWDSIFHTSKVIQDIRNIIDTQIKAIQKIWQQGWNIVKNYFNIVWDAIKNIAKSAINWVKDIVENVTRAIQNTWNNVWNVIKDFFDGIWGGIKTAAKNYVEAVHDAIKSTLDKISDTWHSMWQGLSDFFGGIWDNIKKFAQDGINGVLKVINAGIDGIDAVWKFFTGHETSIHHLKPVKFAQGGIVERSLSMVNDGAGSNWKELIEEPDGNMFMASERNAVLPLKPGTRVYSGEETHQIMSALGVEHYATGGVVGNNGIKHYKDGGIVGDVIDWSAHELKDFDSWIKDKWDAITKFLKHPIENTKAIISKAITEPLNKLSNSNMVDLGKGIFDKLTNPIADWFKKGLEDVKKKHDEESVGGFGNIKDMKNSADLKKLVKAALEANGLSTSDDMIARVMRQIATESGGNAHAVQPGADPDGDGSGPALGLMQTKRATFNAYKAPGHDDIFNAYDNLLAALNYAKHTYGPSLSFLGNGHGYATGGHIMGQELALIGDNPEHEEFVINPYAPSARPLLKQAMDRTQAVQPISQTETASQEQHDSYGERIIELLEAILMKDSYVNLDDASQKLRNHDAQALRMTNMQRGV